MTALNIANGNNTNMFYLNIRFTPNLNCIEVDDVAYSNTNWIAAPFNFEPQHYFSLDCNLNDTPDRSYTLNIGHDFADQAQIADNTNATASEVIDPTIPTPTGCGGNFDSAQYNGDDVWYVVSIPEDGSVIIETETNSSITDTGLAIYSGTPGSLIQMACNDDVEVGVGDYFSLITLTGQTPNALIYIRAWSWGNNETGTFQISAYRNPTVSTFVPDDAFETYLETHDTSGATVTIGNPSSMGNGTIDDYVPTANINTVTNLDVENLGISDLTGIEAFNSLTFLNCPNNALTEIDISKNTNLEWFNCRTNLITNLDTTLNTGLTALDFGDNQIANIDLSNNSALEFLSCFSNLLTSLDLSSFNSLTTIYVDNNRLTSLNICLLYTSDAADE